MPVLTPAMQESINLCGRAADGDEEAAAAMCDVRVLRDLCLAFWVNQMSAEALEQMRELETERERLKAAAAKKAKA